MARQTIGSALLAFAATITLAGTAFAQGQATRATASPALTPQAQALLRVAALSDSIAPDSSLEKPQDIGVAAHTNFLIRRTAIAPRFANTPNGLQPFGGTGPGGGYTPAQIHTAYGVPANAGAGTVAIIIAYDYPGALRDFNAFSTYFGLRKESSTSVTSATNRSLQVVYATGRKPASNVGWNQEAALDIEWSHSMAPNAKIVLVEAASSSLNDLFNAVQVAGNLPNVHQISMSFGGSEFSQESLFDSVFSKSGIVYFASSGDTGGIVEYPSVSPNVVGVGGTSLFTDNPGNYQGESGWGGSGGGPSLYETLPGYQVGVTVNGSPLTRRSVPDISLVADPGTGVSVYYNGGWYVFGGTSVSCPILAGTVNATGTNRTSSNAQLTKIYSGLGSANFHDITTGTAGSFSAFVGWDYVTGVGTLNGTAGL